MNPAQGDLIGGMPGAMIGKAGDIKVIIGIAAVPADKAVGPVEIVRNGPGTIFFGEFAANRQGASAGIP